MREPLHRSVVLFGGLSEKWVDVEKRIIVLRKLRRLKCTAANLRRNPNPSIPPTPHTWYKPFNGLFSQGDDPYVKVQRLRGEEVKLPVRYQLVDASLERTEYARKRLRAYVRRHFLTCGYIDHPLAVNLALEVIEDFLGRKVYVKQGLQLVFDPGFEANCPDEHRPALELLHQRVNSLLRDPWIDWIFVPGDLQTAAVQARGIINACLADRSARSLSQPTGYPKEG